MQKPPRPNPKYPVNHERNQQAYARQIAARQNNRQNNRRKQRRRSLGCLLAGGTSLLLLFSIALLITQANKQEQQPASSAHPTSSMPASQASSPPASVSPKPKSGPPEARSGYAYDEEDLPLLLNAKNPLPDGYEVDPVEVGDGQSLDRRAATAYLAMQAAAKEDGIYFTAYSGWRSHERQVNNYNASIQRYRKQGKSEEEAKRLTEEYYAVPGTSEHEAGLAIDIDGIEESFEHTKAFAWLQENAATYGFILRYPKDKPGITGIAYEPWHYRYVGANHAEEMKKLHITTLEEYWTYYKGDSVVPPVAPSSSSASAAASGRSGSGSNPGYTPTEGDSSKK